MPWRTISGGERPARSTPLSRIWPESGLNAPVMRLKNVLLPAPFGPITAVSEPSAKSSETSSVALTPPKDFREVLRISQHPASSRLRRERSRRCAIPFDDEIHQALTQAEREQQDDDAEHDAVVLGQTW